MLAAGPELAITMNVMVMNTDLAGLEAAKERLDRAGRRLRFLGVKVVTDGSLGGHTAAMDDGYSDNPGERGLLRVDFDETLELSRRSLELGGIVAIHAIGDAANAFTLDIFQILRDEGAPADALRIEHASVLRESGHRPDRRARHHRVCAAGVPRLRTGVDREATRLTHGTDVCLQVDPRIRRAAWREDPTVRWSRHIPCGAWPQHTTVATSHHTRH